LSGSLKQVPGTFDKQNESTSDRARAEDTVQPSDGASEEN